MKKERIKSGPKQKVYAAFPASSDAVKFVTSLYLKRDFLKIEMFTNKYTGIDKISTMSYWVSVVADGDFIAIIQKQAKEFNCKTVQLSKTYSFYNQTGAQLRTIGSTEKIEDIEAFIKDVQSCDVIISMESIEHPDKDSDIVLCINYTENESAWNIIEPYVEKHNINMHTSESLKLDLIS